MEDLAMHALMLFLTLSLGITPAHAGEPGSPYVEDQAPIQIASQGILVDWNDDPKVVLTLVDIDSNSIKNGPTLSGSQSHDDGTWTFKVPKEIIATFTTVILNPETKQVTATVEVEAATATIVGEPQSSYGLMGIQAYYLNLDNAPTCVGPRCEELRKKN